MNNSDLHSYLWGAVEWTLSHTNLRRISSKILDLICIQCYDSKNQWDRLKKKKSLGGEKKSLRGSNKWLPISKSGN